MEREKQEQLAYVGKGRPIRDAALKVTGQLQYVADLKLPHMLYAKMLFSPVAHAKIKKIDTSKAEALPGVQAVVTYQNSPPIIFNSALRFVGHQVPETEYIFADTVRFVGDRVAAVAAEDPETAAKAVRLIEVEYEELPAVFDPEEALQEGAFAIHPGGNAVTEILAESGKIAEGFAEADLIFEDKYSVPAVHHGAMEPHAALASFDFRGKLTIWSSTQSTFSLRLILAKLLELPLSKVRVIRPTIGGAFGGKLEATVEPVVALLAKMTGRPVKLEFNRQEAIVSTRTRHGAVMYFKTGVKKDGTIVAQDVQVLINTGAYASGAISVGNAIVHKVFKLYKNRNLRVKVIPVYTNTPIAGAMRGYGSPQFHVGWQLQLNKIAKELGMDFVELQLKNLVKPEAREARFGMPIGNPRPIDCVVKGAAAFNWQNRKLSEDNGRFKKGIGMAVGVHGNGLYGAHLDATALILKMNEDGTATLFTSSHDMGNGLVTVETQIVGEVLGIDPSEIECVESDTETTGWNLGDYASRGTYVSGKAAEKVALSAKKEILQEAAKLLATAVEELELKNGAVFCTSNPAKQVPLGEVIVYAQSVSNREIICAETHSPVFGPSSYGAHFAEVEVDTETGKVKVLDYVAVQDVGKAINPLAVEGQIEGAVQMGIGYALSETLEVDARGKVINNSLKKYRMPKAGDMPAIKVLTVEEGEETGPFGAKGVGECPVVPSAPAVVNAVANALGVDFYHLPLNPEEVLAALQRRNY